MATPNPLPVSICDRRPFLRPIARSALRAKVLQLTALSLSLTLALEVGWARAVWAEVIDITLLHFNDVYEITPVAGGKSGGLARLATLRQRLRQANPNTLTLLAGDAFSPSALGTAKVDGDRLAGKQMVAVLNALGLDYATFGNHEFDLSEAQFRQRLQESQFGWISSNVTDAAGQPFPGVPLTQLLTFKGKGGATVKLGLLGVTLDSNPASYVGYRDPIQAARSQAIALRQQGANIVVALTHLSLAADQTLAATVPEIDLILGGHEHENIQQWRLVTRSRPGTCPDQGVPIFKADANVRTVYVHRLRYDTVTRCLAIAAQLTAITDALPAEPQTEAVVQQWVERGFAAFRANGFDPGQTVAVTTQPLDGLEASVRNRATGLTDLIGQAMLQTVPEAELAMFNGGSIRIDDVIPPGTVTQYDVIRILPFGGRVLDVRMPGSLLKRVLAQGQANRGNGGYLQTANVTQDAAGTWLIQGKPLVGDRTYRVAINDFLVSGKEIGLDFLTLKSGQVQVVATKDDIRFAVIRQLQRLGGGVGK